MMFDCKSVGVEISVSLLRNGWGTIYIGTEQQ